MIEFSIATLILLGALLFFEKRGPHAAIWVVKPLASAGFLAAAIAAGCFDTAYGRTLFAALVLSFWGDVLLIPRGSAVAFRAGLASFLLAHVAFVVAFAVVGLEPVVLMAGLAVLALVAWRVYAWLAPHLPAKMIVPVRAYIAVITVMVAAGVASWSAGATGVIAAGAVTFWCSDLFVARQRFVAQGYVNRAIGLPLYYGAQLLFVWTIVL